MNSHSIGYIERRTDNAGPLPSTLHTCRSWHWDASWVPDTPSKSRCDSSTSFMRSACPVFVLGVLVSLQGVCALNFNPSDYQAAVGRQVTVTWTTSKGDPSTADLQLVLDNSIVAADVVDVGGFFHLFKIADTVQPGDGYAFKFVSTDGSAKLLAEIGTFSIASGGGAQTSPAQTTFHDPDFPTSPASSSGISTTRPFSSSSASPPLAGSSSPGQSSSSLVSTGAGTKSSTSIGPESSGAATSTRGTAHLSSSTITAIVVVAVLLPLIAGLGLWLWLLRRRRAAEDEPNAGSSRTPRVTPFRMLPSTARRHSSGRRGPPRLVASHGLTWRKDCRTIYEVAGAPKERWWR
ncbi:hypothetical protein MIND_00915300 [Mycena indigotica]|uniref:Ser-Thr-rich glycosyl-phosphatidyl-inositol-anchored membrane family-domain-containing protein n=1 Tax=Mycena indigotica TaxID=2126181 RepID=A0A8H6SC64_9AGAR|nr:uncharacterized protein MIND_00915300 [Mycena indigotica]KAF7296840.1 hypothetical protein MIND_00915300 [Mycena indigotica]